MSSIAYILEPALIEPACYTKTLPMACYVVNDVADRSSVKEFAMTVQLLQTVLTVLIPYLSCLFLHLLITVFSNHA